MLRPLEFHSRVNIPNNQDAESGDRYWVEVHFYLQLEFQDAGFKTFRANRQGVLVSSAPYGLEKTVSLVTSSECILNVLHKNVRFA